MFKSFFGGKAEISTDPDRIAELLDNNVEEIFVRESLESKLRVGKQLRVKLGIDPTGANLHLGHAVALWKLRAFQDLGHKVIFVVGDFTAKIGDPSDKLDKRPMLDADDVRKNVANFRTQVGRIINLSKAEIVYNGNWLSKLGFEEVCGLAESFSVQQMVNRRNFKERIEKGTEISLREFLYPLMQGYDSVMVRSDVEIGGFDQLFNLKAGRIIQKHYGQSEQDILTTRMLIGTDGRKMSKSWGNVINLTDSAENMFGKIMSLKDELITDYYLLCANASVGEIENIKSKIGDGENPRDIKLDLASRIVSLYHGDSVAQKAKADFIQTFSERRTPANLRPIKVKSQTALVDVLVDQGVIKSKSEWRRLVSEGAVSDLDNNRPITDPNQKIENDLALKIGKRRFVKIESN